MPLIIDLKSGEKVIVNGSVIENAGSSTKLRIHNQSNILKQKEIMSDAEANTPASRLYFCLQCAYIFPDDREKYVKSYIDYSAQYVEACPSGAPIISDIAREVEAERYYKALRAARKLLKHEAALFEHMRKANEEGG